MGSKCGMLACRHNSEVHKEALVKASSFKILQMVLRAISVHFCQLVTRSPLKRGKIFYCH
jgi:hypothetical protein